MGKTHTPHFTMAVFLVGIIAATASQAYSGPPVYWASQFGNSSFATGSDIALDGAGDCYIAGSMWDNPADPSSGTSDVILAKYSHDGQFQWLQQIGSTLDDHGATDWCHGLAVDPAGNSYVTGNTKGEFTGTWLGRDDVFTLKHNSDGAMQWAAQISELYNNSSYGAGLDPAGNPIIVGQTMGGLGGANLGSSDAFVVKYDTAGNQLWSAHLGTEMSDSFRDVDTDALGNVYVCGQTNGDLTPAHAGDTNAFVAKYNSDGALQWIREIGTAEHDQGRGIAVDAAGNSYIVGATHGDLDGSNVGSVDVFVAMYDPAGVQQWVTQIGTSAAEYGYGIALDAAGNSYITGQTEGNLCGQNTGDDDLFAMQIDPQGVPGWRWQDGTPELDAGAGIAVAADGTVVITGKTYGDLYRTNEAEHYEAFVVALVPEPATALLLAVGALSLVRHRRR